MKTTQRIFLVFVKDGNYPEPKIFDDYDNVQAFIDRLPYPCKYQVSWMDFETEEAKETINPESVQHWHHTVQDEDGYNPGYAIACDGIMCPGPCFHYTKDSALSCPDNV